MDVTCNAGDPGPIPGPGRSPGEGNGNPLQFSCLESSTDRGVWQATVYRVTESDMTKQLTHTWMSPARDITPPPTANRRISETSPHPHREERVEIITRNWQAGGGGVSSLNSSSLGH